MHCRRRLERAYRTGRRRGTVVVDLAGLAFMDCYSLNQLMAAREQARRAGGDLVLAGPQPIVLRLLVLCDVAGRGLVFASVDEAATGAGSAPAALVMSRAMSRPRWPGPGSCRQRCWREGRP